MSTAFQSAKAQVLLADFASTDASGKLNVIGGGITLVGVTPQGSTPPLHVIVMMQFPEELAGTEYSLSVELRDDAGGAVIVPTTVGKGEALRVQQLATVDSVTLGPNLQKPVGLRSHSTYVLGFPHGLPLARGTSYRWKVLIDGQSRPGWETTFSVLAELPPPVFGGPAGDGAIEDVATADDVEEDPDS